MKNDEKLDKISNLMGLVSCQVPWVCTTHPEELKCLVCRLRGILDAGKADEEFELASYLHNTYVDTFGIAVDFEELSVVKQAKWCKISREFKDHIMWEKN